MNFKWKCKCGFHKIIIEEKCEICGEKYVKWYDNYSKYPKYKKAEYFISGESIYAYKISDLEDIAQQIRERIPKGIKEEDVSIYCGMMSEEYSNHEYFGFSAYCERWETDEEYETRIKEMEERDLKELARLKEKYK